MRISDWSSDVCSSDLLDETYVKVRGKWTYLYRAVDKRGDTIDFYLSPTRSAKAAKRFLGKALRGLKHWEKPATLNTALLQRLAAVRGRLSLCADQAAAAKWWLSMPKSGKAGGR